MNTKTAIIASTAVVGFVGLATTAYQSTMKDLYKRFPDLDHKVIRKAYRTFIMNSAAQQYGDMNDFDYNQMDKIFLDIVQKQNHAIG